MKNILKSKLFFILIISILLIGSISSSCFASSDFSFTAFDKNNYTFTLNDELTSQNYYYIFSFSSSSYTLVSYFCSNYELELGDGLLSVKDYSKYNDYYLKYYCSSLIGAHVSFDSAISDFSNLTVDTLSTSSGYYFNGTVLYGTCLYANHDLYNIDGTLVFQVAPQEGAPQITTTLVTETTRAQINKQIQATITGFLKYLIVFVISVIAFWKGWQFLSRQFKRA